MTPFDEPNKQHVLTPEQLDKSPLDFGKHRGRTPEMLAEGSKDDKQYVVWAYENVVRYNRPVFCSEVLYKECGGKFKSKKQQEEAKVLATRKIPADVRNPPGARQGFNDMDDDIPF